MPLNLAQTAVSALKIGENALTAIYSGIIRVYPNEVTVSIDGANASSQSGTPGQPMNSFVYTVTPSGNYGWTSAQIAAATLTGLPAGFTATFSSSGSLGSQTGTWAITTTDGNFPNTDTAITVASLTSTISETQYGTVVINIVGNGSVGASTNASQSYTISGSNFIGSTVSGTVAGTANVAYTDVGILLNPTYQTGSDNTSTTSGDAITFSWINSGTGRYQKQCSVSRTVNAIGTSTSSGTIFGESVGQSPSLARAITIVWGGPPWNTNPVAGAQVYSKVYYDPNSSLEIDPRARCQMWIAWTLTAGSSQPGLQNPTVVRPYITPPVGDPGYYFSNTNLGSGLAAEGTYTANMYSNVGLPGINQSQRGNIVNSAQTWGWT